MTCLRGLVKVRTRGDPLSRNLVGIQGSLRAGALTFILLLPGCRFGPCLWRAGFWAIKKSKSKKTFQNTNPLHILKKFLSCRLKMFFEKHA